MVGGGREQGEAAEGTACFFSGYRLHACVHLMPFSGCERVCMCVYICIIF